MAVQISGTGDESLTVDTAAPVFESLLSDEEEREESETPPAQKQSPEPEQPEDAASEQADQPEGESEPEQQPEETEEAPEAPAPDLSQKFKTKIDGQEIEVTLEEALKGYSRTQDYTRKTQELAERRKAFESESEAVRAERVQMAQYLRALEQAVDEVTPKEPDWDKVRQDHPAEFSRLWAEWHQGEKERQQLRAQREAAEAQVQKDFAEKHQRHMEAERQAFVEAVPEWKDEAVRKAEKTRMVEYAKGLGFTAEQLSQVDNHKVLLMLRKSMLWDEAQAKKPALALKIEKVRTATPGAANVTRPPVSEQTRALQRLAKTGKGNDLASVFMTMLPDD